VKNVKQHTTSELEEHIRVCQAELDSRKSATPVTTSVYERAGCLGETQREQLDMFLDGIKRNVSITKMSTRGNPEFISGNVKNYARKLGNLAGCREIVGLTSTNYPSITISAQNTSVPEMVARYFEERRLGGTGFRTEVTLVQTGTYEGNPFGIVVKPNGIRYAVGKLKSDKVQAFKDSHPHYKHVDKATKGHRARMDGLLVFDPTQG
jgi:hypothetical protein